MAASDKQWIDAIGLRLQDALGCADLDIDTKELITATFQIGLLMEPRLLQQFQAGNSLIESSYFDDQDDMPREVKGKHWRMIVRKGKMSKL
jgi:hypothetical protein